VCVCVCEYWTGYVVKLCQLKCFNDKLENYMFRYLLAIVRFSSRELMFLYIYVYTYMYMCDPVTGPVWPRGWVEV